MEPITTTAAVASVVGYLVKTLKENKPIKDFFNDFTEASVNWIRPLFLKTDGTPTEAVEKLKANPDSQAKQEVLKAAINSELEDNHAAKQYIEEMARIINNKSVAVQKQNTVTNIGNNNIVLQDISNAGDITIGKQ